MKVAGSDGKKVLWEVVDDHAVEEENDCDEIVIWGFGFNLFEKD